jgi:hypothetical protein
MQLAPSRASEEESTPSLFSGSGGQPKGLFQRDPLRGDCRTPEKKGGPGTVDTQRELTICIEQGILENFQFWTLGLASQARGFGSLEAF